MAWKVENRPRWRMNDWNRAKPMSNPDRFLCGCCGRGVVFQFISGAVHSRVCRVCKARTAVTYLSGWIQPIEYTPLRVVDFKFK